MTVKYGKLYMKDSSGNLNEIVPEAHMTITEYTGATISAAGVPGLVPGALSSQKDKFLKGDGSWATIYDDNVVALSGTNIDLSLGRTFTKTISANTTFTISNAPTGKMTVFTLGLSHSGNIYTVTWPANVYWNGGTAPAGSPLDILSFMTLDGGTNWYGNVVYHTMEE